jgi:hypothetical protein
MKSYFKVMIKQVCDALSEGFAVQLRPYVGKVIVDVWIRKNDNDYYFNKVCSMDEKEIALAIEYVCKCIKEVME